MCGRLRVGKDFLHVAGLVGAAHLSRNSLKMTRHFEKPEGIVAKALEAKALMSDIVEILIGNADERRQSVFQHANDDK
jgi:hypothetical protein